jgi:hypothetical protein
VTILYPAPRQIKSPRKFAAGLLATRPAYRTDYSASDAEWNAAQNAARAALDKRADRMANEARALDRLSSGYCC